jgi:hypothetical protein
MKSDSVLKETKYSELPPVEKKFDATGIEQLLTFTDEQEKTLDMNHTGIAVFHMAFQGSNSADCITMVADSKTLEWPSGQCWKVVRDLKEEFAPEDLISILLTGLAFAGVTCESSTGVLHAPPWNLLLEKKKKLFWYVLIG